ncbi:YafY family protein [Paenibacillus filicis]|uniref:YafY family protein n=1 Tax=Paenibacillus gyeongsangnamensis TaxID=3388067 RepID=A0ABT4QGF2_9BACL|nr:YafY family protein [Paenibacillus filicis]MCZ8515927.1 YafY family protein [Paenibacillus filicis]
MSKSKRLMALMIAVNKRRKFTVRELAEEFQVSTRTIMRDLQVLDELGLPLYAEYGPHGGYRVLNERLLPPIMFSEQEAVAMFFAYQSLQHFGALPFSEESVTALNKFYYYLPEDTKQKIDKMKQRVVFWTPKRPVPTPHLRLLLDAGLQQRPLRILYDSREGAKKRPVQPVGVYSYNGFWYCPSYCFMKERFLLFRVDRVLEADWAEETHPAVDLSEFPIADWFKPPGSEQHHPLVHGAGRIKIKASLSVNGVKRSRWEKWFEDALEVHEDGTGTLMHFCQEDEIDFYVRQFLSFGSDIVAREPEALVARIRREVARLQSAYLNGG